MRGCLEESFLGPPMVHVFPFQQVTFFPGTHPSSFLPTHSNTMHPPSTPLSGISLLRESLMPSANWEIQFREVEKMWNIIDFSIFSVESSS